LDLFVGFAEGTVVARLEELTKGAVIRGLFGGKLTHVMGFDGSMAQRPPIS
jgi:hypothetical protein